MTQQKLPRPVRRVVARLLQYVVCSGLAVAFASPALTQDEAAEPAAATQRADVAARVDELLVAIETEANRSGPPSEALGELLAVLARAYHDAAEYDLAAAYFARALEVVRMHNGLTSFEQAPLLRDNTLNEEQRGNFASVQALEARLARLAAGAENGRSAVDVLEWIADRQVEAFVRFLEQGTPFNVKVNPQVEESYSVTPLFDERGAALEELARARESYTEATAIIRAGRAYGIEKLAALETKLVRSFYLEATLRGATTPAAAHELGEASYRRVIGDKEEAAVSAESVATTFVELGDWHLAFNRYPLAHEAYRHAHDLVAGRPGAADFGARVLAPLVPVRVPAFLSSPLVGTLDSRADLLVLVRLSEYGQAEVEQIVTKGAPLTRDLRRRVGRFFVRNRFRPQIVDGDIPRRARLDVGYSLAVASSADAD